MSLPITLNVGTVAVYGDGSTGTTPQGILLGTDMKWGSIYNVWDGGQVFVYSGDTVTFKENDVIVRLAIGSAHYTILPCKLVTKEDPVL